MANNTRATGAFYIGPGGNDANDGLTPDTQKATLAVYGAGVHVVGGGEYKGAFNLTNTTFVADGHVKINMTADMVVSNATLTPSPGIESVFEIVGNGFNVSFTNNYFYPTDCIFDDCNMNQSPQFGRCVATRCAFRAVTMGTYFIPIMEYCSFFNCTMTNILFSGSDSERINNSDIDESTTVNLPQWFATPSVEFLNNNAKNIFIIGGVQYELKQEKDGTAIDPNPGIADITGIDANIYTRGNFSQDTAYQNVSKGDFTAVMQTSPNLAAGSDGFSNIGAVKYCIYKSTADLEFSSPDTLQDLVLSTGDYIYDIIAGTGFGFFISDPFLVSLPAKTISAQTFAALINFNRNEAIGSTENNNLPAVDDFAFGTAGINPTRLTYLLRYSTGSTIPTVSGDYDNAGYAAAGSFFKMEYSKKGVSTPKVDVSGNGSGEVAFVGSGAVKIAPTYVQLGIYLQEGKS